MAYTPELSQNESATLRRLAWFQKSTMVKTLRSMLKETVEKYECDDVCSACKDKSKCGECVFKVEQSTKERSL
ncbi:hypothetical protein QUF70_17480 [Desulfobacterales bacterium HSG17]|nr:hypothetical protein [Desulfobacterales bacterium HSG17]